MTNIFYKVLDQEYNACFFLVLLTLRENEHHEHMLNYHFLMDRLDSGGHDERLVEQI